jgi:hypothetical protein
MNDDRMFRIHAVEAEMPVPSQVFVKNADFNASEIRTVLIKNEWNWPGVDDLWRCV